MREPKTDLYPKDIDAIARAAFESHLPGEFWDDKGEDVKAQWRDRVEPAIAGRNSQDGIPAIEAAIVGAWQAHIAPPKPKFKPVADVPVKVETPKKK